MQWEESQPAPATQPRRPALRVEELASARSIRLSALAAKAADLILLIEPLWVVIAVAVVYAMVQTGGKYSWVPLLLAALPYPLRQWRKGYLSQRTPFDIPIVLFMAGAIVGTVVSKDLMLSLGALQTIVAAALLYYTLVNYHRPKLLLTGILVIACIATPLICIWGFAAGFNPASGASSPSSWAAHIFSSLPVTKAPSTEATPILNPMVHGLLLLFLITSSILLCTLLFARNTVVRLAAGIPCALLVVFGVLSMGKAWWNLSSGVTLNGRLELWDKLLPTVQSHLWTGIGLGNFPLVTPMPWNTHAHNSYLELYLNYGLLGALAGIVIAVMVVKLGWDILRSPRNHAWFGFGCGVLLAIAAAGIMGFFESAPVGMPAGGAGAWHYAVSPIPWLLGAALVATHQILTRSVQSKDKGAGRFLSGEEMNQLFRQETFV